MTGKRYSIILCLFFLHVIESNHLPVSFAGTASILGMSSRSAAMAGAMTAAANDHTAAFYNPALISEIVNFPDNWFKADTTYIFTTRNFNASTSTEKLIHKDLKTNAISTGFLLDLERITGLKKFSVGLSLYIPADTVLTIDIPESSKSPYFPIYDELCTTMSFYFGLGYRLSKKISVGAAVNILATMPDADSHIVAYVEAQDVINNLDLTEMISEQELDATGSLNVKVGVNRELVAVEGYHAGISFDITDNIRFGASYREELNAGNTGNQYLYLTLLNPDGSVNSQLSKRLPIIKLPQVFAMYYTPEEYSAGFSFDLPNYIISFDITYSLWSGYIGQHTERPGNRFDDTWNPRVGIEYRFTDYLTFWGGYVLRETPVPEQKWDSNYLDSDTNTYCLGGELNTKYGCFQAHLQIHVLSDHTIAKEGETPDIHFSGTFWNTGIGYSVLF